MVEYPTWKKRLRRAASATASGLALSFACLVSSDAAQQAVSPKLTAVDPAKMVSTAEIQRWLDQRDAAGPAYTGGPAWKKFMALIHAELKRDFEAEIRTALQSAKAAAGFEFLGALVRTCLLPQSGGEDTNDTVPGYVTNPASAPARATWYAEPAKVFDNLYFVGGQVHSAWALTTSEGIILIDTIFPYNSEELIVGGMQKVGLDPKNIKYVLISHAHADHIGGAEMLQARYGARIVMGGPDWDWVAKYPNRYKTMAPKRDIVATDGMKVTLGDTTVTIWLTPGHTPGTLSYTFTVLDRGKPVSVAYSGGTAFNFVNNTPDPGIKNFQIYIDSQLKMAEKAAATRATVLLANHSEFDNAVNKNRMLAGRGNGPHPYELGADWVQRYFRVTQGCARAAQIRLEQKVVETARR